MPITEDQITIIPTSEPHVRRQHINQYGELLIGMPTAEDLAETTEGVAEATAAVARVDPDGNGIVPVNVKHPTFGATGNGTTNDTTAFHAARDSGAKRIYVPPGTYVAQLVCNVPGQTWDFDRDATLIGPAAMGEFGATLTVTAADVTIIGEGEIDGNRANQSGNNVFGVYATGDRLRWDGPDILSGKKHGMYIFGGTGHTVRNLNTFDTGQNGFYAIPNGKHMDNCTFENIVCDRSTETTGYLQGGFKLLGTGTYKIRKPVMRNIRGILPDPTVADGTSANGNVSLEVWYAEDGQLDDLYGFGGWISVSVGYLCKRLAIGKITGEKARSNCVELSGFASGTSGVFNTVGQVVANGVSVTRRPVTLIHFDDLQIESIITTDAGYDNGGNLSALVYVTSCDRVQIGRIDARMGAATGTGSGLFIESSTDMHIGTAIVEGGAGTEVDAAIRLHAGCDGFTIGGGKLSGFAYDFRISASTAVNTDNVVVSGVRMGTGTNLFSYTGSATEGDNVRLLGCPGLVRNGKACDIINRKLDVIRAWGTGSPESVVTAGIGSEYIRTDGGAGTSRYVKESGTGNTGWIGK